MSVTINGTSGVTTPGIANSEGYTGDGLTIAAGAPAGAVTLNASGNLSTVGTLSINTGGLATYFRASGTAYTQIGDNQTLGAGTAFVIGSSTPYLGFNTAGFERARFDASGNLLVGTTSTNLSAGAFYIAPGTNAELGIGHGSASPSGATFVSFRFNNTAIGSITQSGATGVAYNTSSDYRLKENVAPLTNALDKIASLKPCTFTWKADGSADRGFIAHELQEVIPQAVSGEKDAVDDKGNIMPQGVDYGKITPELVAAIQEQQAIITELKARIEQLETK